VETTPQQAAAIQKEEFVEEVRATAPVIAPPAPPPIVQTETPAPAPVPVEIPASAPVNVAAVPEPQKPATNSWFSSVASPWDAEAQKVAQLASTWDAPAAAEPAPPPSIYSAEPLLETAQAETHEAVAIEDPGATVDSLAPALSADVKAQVEEAALPAGTVEAIREEAHQAAETEVHEEPAVAASTTAPETSMEDMVAKVLSKMSPEMLQAVTREILKPVVEAMVRDEMAKK
jgi:hypothetical protein